MTTKDDLINYFNNISSLFEKLCTSLNPSVQIEEKTWDTQMGRFDTALSCGEGFEKASSIYCDVKIETPPVLAEEIGQKGITAEALVVEINLFPVNPYISKGYIELRANITDKIVFAGGTDLYPYFETRDTQDDVGLFADEIKKLCDRHDQDYEALQKTRAGFFQSKYNNEKVGSHAGIYSFHIEEKDFPFFKDMGETFFKVYGEIVGKRKGKPYSENDRDHQLKLHGKWAQWALLEDEGTKYGLDKGIPPDALLRAILPPTAKF